MTGGEIDLRREIAAAADEAGRWDAQAGTYAGLADDDLRAARAALLRLVERLEWLEAAATAGKPVDEALVGTARRALRTARHNEAWAGYVLHQRLPPTDLSTLA